MKKRIGDFIHIKHGFAFESRYFSETGEFIVLTPGNFHEKGGFRNNGSKIKYYLGEFPEEYLLKKDDLLVVMTEQAPGLLGSPAIIPCNAKYLHNQRLGLVEFTHPGKLDKNYLFHMLNFPSTRQQISKTAGGTKVRHTSPTKLEALSIYTPTIGQQRNIAELIMAWDSAIEKSERLIELKEQQFAHLLSHLIVAPSAHWKSRELGDAFEPIARKNTVGETNVLTSSAEYGLISQLEYYSKSVSAEDVSGYYLIERGEFAYNRSAAKGYPYGAIKRLDRYDRGVLSTLYLCFSQKKDLGHDSDFLSFYFESGILNQQLAEICQEGARSHGLLNITKADFFGIVVNLPDVPEQKRISKVLNMAKREIEILRQQNRLLQQQKSFLMSKLLTGEWEAPELGAKGK